MIGDSEKVARPKRALQPQEVEGLVLDLDFDDPHSNDDVQAARAARARQVD